MGDLISALIIAVVQGLTEWVPVSSSGHLVVVERILGYDGSLLFDVALHFGTLMAVFIYFGKDITDILQDWFRGRWDSENSRLGVLLAVATIPAVIFGFLLRNIFDSVFESLLITGLGFGVTGLFLIIASLDFKRREREIGYVGAFVIGIAQVFSLFPGVSRSGSTISSGVLLGLDGQKAARFSFLMAIPVVFGANVLIVGGQKLPPNLIWATLVAFAVGLLTIHLIYSYVISSKRNLRWFGIYALLIGVAVVVWSLIG